MRPPNRSEREADRLATLSQYRILDTEAEPEYDRLTRLAAQVCRTPVSVVTLVDEHRQWFKSRFGLDADSIPREYPLCAYAIESDDCLVIDDMARDNRFASYPVVTGEPRIRSYLGAPLTVGPDLRLGTLCVIDVEPREFTADEIEALGTLRDAVVNLLELRRTRRLLESVRSVVPVCAWCDAVRIAHEQDEIWVRPHEFVAAQHDVTHGICPTCARSMLAEVPPDEAPSN